MVNPRIFDGILTAEECNAIIEVAAPKLAPSSMAGRRIGERIQTRARTSSECWLASDEFPEGVQLRLLQIVATTTGKPVEHIETLRVVRYKIGEFYRAHQDWFPQPQERFEEGGQRTHSAVLYLRKPEAGGETYFPVLKLRVEPRAGRLLVWNNLDQDNNPSPEALHEATPPTAGTKWVLTTWVREHPFKRLD